MSASLYLLPPLQTAKPGDTFFLGLYIHSDQQITGADYTLSISGAILIGRDLTLSSLPDVIDNTLAGDLGGSVNDVRSPLTEGDHFLASYQFRVNAMASQALVKPEPYSNTVGYVLGPPDFRELAFSSMQGAVVNVVPEPAVWVGIVVGICWMLLCRAFR